MLEAIHKLMRPGGLEVARKFRLTRAFWTAFFKESRSESLEVLADKISQAQWKYEFLFDNRRGLAKETMPFTCLGALYDPASGWGRRKSFAIRLIKAFALSRVSVEVKYSAREAAILYGLDTEEDLKHFCETGILRIKKALPIEKPPF